MVHVSTKNQGHNAILLETHEKLNYINKCGKSPTFFNYSELESYMTELWRTLYKTRYKILNLKFRQIYVFRKLLRLLFFL